jgi:hypothetical protein
MVFLLASVMPTLTQTQYTLTINGKQFVCRAQKIPRPQKEALGCCLASVLLEI